MLFTGTCLSLQLQLAKAPARCHPSLIYRVLGTFLQDVSPLLQGTTIVCFLSGGETEVTHPRPGRFPHHLCPSALRVSPLAEILSLSS